MPILNKNKLRIHFVNVGHGDAIILEFPDYNNRAHFGVVDTGRPENKYKSRMVDYLEELVKLRGTEFQIDFVCITHPHEDHYGGLETLLDRFAQPGTDDFSNRIYQFWDCGFRITAKTYNNILKRISDDNHIVFIRVAAGAEFEFGDVGIFVLAPSLDLRNRFDTFGVDKNNASVVLRVQYKKATAILTGDAQFDSWGKIAEEFPRTKKITYFKEALVSRSEGTNQLKCQLLKVSHHGSKHGTSLEYLEKLKPKYFMITCADQSWYMQHKPGWGIQWPHQLTKDIIYEASNTAQVHQSNKDKNVIYTLSGKRVKEPEFIDDSPGEPNFSNKLRNILI